MRGPEDGAEGSGFRMFRVFFGGVSRVFKGSFRDGLGFYGIKGFGVLGVCGLGLEGS